MKVTLEKRRYDLSKHEINTDTLYEKLDSKLVLEHFGYKKELSKISDNTSNKKENKLQIMELIKKLFEFHNIKIEEWPLILKELSYKIITEKKFYEVMNPHLIEKVSERFQVNKQVFYSNSDRFFKIEYHGFYKNVKNFSDYVYNEIYKKDGKMYILSEKVPDKNIDEETEGNRFALIFQIPLFEINNKQIYTYKIFDDSYRWGYWKCRYNLKSFLLCLRKKGVRDAFWQGNIIDNKKNLNNKLNDFSKGNIKFNELIKPRIDWYPEDFIDLPSNSIRAKETEELKKILENDVCKSYD
jgi:hypothetical protein